MTFDPHKDITVTYNFLKFDLHAIENEHGVKINPNSRLILPEKTAECRGTQSDRQNRRRRRHDEPHLRRGGTKVEKTNSRAAKFCGSTARALNTKTAK